LQDCNILYNLVRGSGNMITPEIEEKLEQSKCLNSTVNVCCPKIISIQENNVIKIKSRRRSSNLLASIEQCEIISQDRIVGGNITDVDEYPWTGLIQYADCKILIILFLYLLNAFLSTTVQNKGKRSFFCGSSLITERY
jgi:hypothetical protein